MVKDNTMLVVYVGAGEMVQNRYGIFRKNIEVEVSRAVGEAVLKYPSFQEAEQKEESAGTQTSKAVSKNGKL